MQLQRKINNTNIRWAADSFTYALDIYGTGTSSIIKTITGNSFIYSGEIKYIFGLSDMDSKNISNVKISFSDVFLSTRTILLSYEP